jgi:predicted permease
MAVLWPRINVSLQAVAQVLLVIGLGVWLSARRGFDRKAIAAVSGVNWHVLMPALMVGGVGVTWALLLQLLGWWEAQQQQKLQQM